jgi:hypothetical protein
MKTLQLPGSLVIARLTKIKCDVTWPIFEATNETSSRLSSWPERQQIHSLVWLWSNCIRCMTINAVRNFFHSCRDNEQLKWGIKQWRRQGFWRPGANVIFVAPLAGTILYPLLAPPPSGARGQPSPRAAIGVFVLKAVFLNKSGNFIFTAR